MKYCVLLILSFFLFSCSSTSSSKKKEEKSILAIELSELQNCWKKKCTRDEVLDMYGPGRSESEIQTASHQLVYFSDREHMTPFTSFSFNSYGKVIHILHIPKKMHMNRIIDVIKCNWEALEDSPYVSRQMNDETTSCKEQEITVHFNANTQQVIKILWGKIQ